MLLLHYIFSGHELRKKLQSDWTDTVTNLQVWRGYLFLEMDQFLRNGLCICLYRMFLDLCLWEQICVIIFVVLGCK